jgi:UDP-N-acetylglucosamine/UDP-N-acetylgalactosamine diphosphorylase
MKQELLAHLRPFGQEHLVAFWDEFDEAQQQRLAEQIHSVDFPLIAKLAKGHQEGPDWDALSRRVGPPPAIRLTDADRPSKAKRARILGEDALRFGRVGMILVAGGVGTRLGFDHPKGMFPIGPVSQRSLFAILIQRLLAVSRHYGARIPLYLMTSRATHDETVSYLAQNGRFGLPADDLKIFCQGSLPAVDATSGKLLLSAKGELFLGPDGHGGMLSAFCGGGESCLADAQRRGIAHLFYGQIDNPLTQVCDPELIGFHRLARSEMTTQVVEKSGPLEKVGNVAAIDGQVRIIEYSDLPRDVAEARTDEGTLRLWAGNIAVHVFETSFLARMASQADALPFHRAKKKTPFLDPASGQLVEPAEPNAVKFERFIFDLLPWAKNAIAVEAAKAQAFAPVKNAIGAPADTPATAKAALISRDTALLRALGAKVDDGVPVELGPRFELGDIEPLTRVALAHLHVREPMYFA